MAFKKIPLTIDTMIRNPVPVEGINQEDNTELNIVVTENKTPKDLSNQTIKVYIRRIDGTLVEQTDQITPTNASKGEVTVKLKNGAFNKEGYALFQLDISDSSGRITSSYATFKVGKGLVSGEAIANTNEIEALKKVEEYIKKANQELETFKQTVAEINENEATRRENEVVRVRKEASRNEAEAIRTQQEATRKEKENERVQAETKRIADEEVRRENEALRGSKELERKQAEELRKEKELLRIADENNRKVAESKRIEAESVRVEAEKLRVTAETERVEAENLRVISEEERVAAETKREEGFNAFEGRISANTKELKAARSATTGERFDTLDERIDCEVDRLNKKIDVTMLQQEGKESHVIENTVEGMTTNMIIKGKTLQNLFISENVSLIDDVSCSNGVFDWNVNETSTMMTYKKMQVEDSVKYTIICNVIENTLSPMARNTVRLIRPESYGCEVFLPEGFTTGIFKTSFTTNKNNAGRWDDDYANIYIIGTTGRIKFSLVVIKGDIDFIPNHFEDVKSFGEQEGNKISYLSNGKNLFDGNLELGGIGWGDGKLVSSIDRVRSIDFIKVEPNWNIRISLPNLVNNGLFEYDVNKNFIKSIQGVDASRQITLSSNTHFVKLQVFSTNLKQEIQLEQGTQVTPYQPYKQDKKDILLQNLGFDEGLRGIKNITDELNSIRSVAIKRIGKREYREGDLLLDNVITDKVNTYYVLEEPIETPLDENINLKTFGEKTYVSFENAISGTSSFKAPVNTVATIARLNRENRALEEENRSLRQDFESTTLSLTDSDLELVKQNVDMDFRLMEVEFALDIPQAILSSNIKFKNKKGEVKSMARTPYEMMKIVILSGDYDREDYIHKVGKYYERRRMTKEEHDELMSLMTADEVIGG